MKIAIIDIAQTDLGLKILYPEADYYNLFEKYDMKDNIQRYNIECKKDIENITDDKYDYLFIIVLYLGGVIEGAQEEAKFYRNNFLKILDIINKNNFKKVFIFDNHDYDYDPNDVYYNEKITLFFKRNYNKNKIYKENVIPFSFIMFLKYSIIEVLDNKRLISSIAENRLFFSGDLYNYKDEGINYVRNRFNLYLKIHQFIFNPNKVDYNEYLDMMNNSKYCLDLNGMGDPNKRTFEILAQGSLRIAEYNELKWCFDEDFCEETIFHNEIDFQQKIIRLVNDEALYNKCLDRQNEIVEKYFNRTWIKNYLDKYINL